MLKIKKTVVLLLTVFFCGTATYAQTQTGDKVSDKEIKQFVSAVKKVQVINQASQQKMMKAVENSGLDRQRFNEIYVAMQDPDTDVDSSDEEMEKFNKANTEIVKIQTEAEQELKKEILDQNLTIERYQEITMQLQNDPELMQKVQALIQENG
ncbi:MAG: DUF4168 domain-containing protein [Bacteroidales bacterium]|nr:DUF4168 domain-containing protein [Bacteroidales bacterium]